MTNNMISLRLDEKTRQQLQEIQNYMEALDMVGKRSEAIRYAIRVTNRVILRERKLLEEQTPSE